MRIWDVPVDQLCKNHLLGEHRELHAVWNIITLGKKGYSTHPETKRWVSKLCALYRRHEEEVIEITRRGWRHESPLDENLTAGQSVQNDFITPFSEQRRILTERRCGCFGEQ